MGLLSAEGGAIGWWVPVGLSLSKWSSFELIRVKVGLGEVNQQRGVPPPVGSEGSGISGKDSNIR